MDDVDEKEKWITALDNSRPKLIIKFPTGNINTFYYDGYKNADDSGTISLTNLTADEFNFLTGFNNHNWIDNWNLNTYDIINLCNSLRDKGWKYPELYVINLPTSDDSNKEPDKSWKYGRRELKIPQPPYKIPDLDILTINGKDYTLQKLIIHEMKTVNDMYDVIGRAEITIPDHYTPYIDRTISLLMENYAYSYQYGANELALLDFLGFPLEYISEGFLVLDTLIILNSPLKDYENTLLEYGFVVSNDENDYILYGILGTVPEYTIFEFNSHEIFSLDIITPCVAEFIKNRYIDGTFDFSYNSDAQNLISLWCLAKKYGYSLVNSPIQLNGKKHQDIIKKN
jgi:hypothetical protein